MKTYGFLLLLLTTSAKLSAQSPKAIFIQDSLKCISSQFKFTEGASVDKAGNVFFTDQPDDKIWKYDTSGQLSVFLDKSGRANGTMFDKQGNLVVCADAANEIWSVDKHKKVSVLFSDLDGKKVNGPNDIWLDNKGGIYFTDPYYQRDYWSRTKPEVAGERVYYLPKGRKTALAVASDLLKPNGIVGTPDGKFLYVADMNANTTYRYRIHADGSLSNREALIPQNSDGMTLDSEGNIYLTGKGVSIYTPGGKLLGHIEVPESWCGNLCFGGKKRNILFITASKSLYQIPTTARGVE